MDNSHSKTITLRESIVEESRNTIDTFKLDEKTLGDILKSLPKCNKAKHGRYKTQINLDMKIFDFSLGKERKSENNKKSIVQEEKDNENSDEDKSQIKNNEANDDDEGNNENDELFSAKSICSFKDDEDNHQLNQNPNQDLDILVSTIQQQEINHSKIHKLPSYLESITYLENQFIMEKLEETSKAEIDKMRPMKKSLTINAFEIANHENKEELFNNIKSNTRMKIGAMCRVGDEIFLAAENGLVYKYSLKDNKELFVFKTKDLPSNCVLWCIDSDIGKYIVTGFSNGNVNLIHNIKQKSLGIIKNITKSGILIIRMILSKKQRTTFIVCDFGGMIYKVKVRMNFLLKNETVIEKIYNNTIPIYNVIFMRWNKEQLIAFSTLESIQVMKIKPELKTMITIPRDKNTIERFLFDFSFGIGKLNIEISQSKSINDQNSDKTIEFKNLFCIVKECFIILYSFEIENNTIINMYQVGEFNTYTTIIKIGFISSSLLYFIDEFFKMKMINTMDFNMKQISLYIEGNIKQNIIYMNHLNILNLNIFADLKNRINKATYFNFISSNGHSVLLLGKNMISFVSLKTSEQCMLDLIKLQEWDTAMELASDVLKGNNGIWEKDTLVHIKDKLVYDLMFKYMEYIIHLNRPFNDTSSPKESLLVRCFDFCIDINMFNSIIDKIYPLFVSNHNSDLFFNTLQPYVFLDYFNNKNIQSDFIKELIKVYLNRKQLLTSLLFHFDFKCLETADVYNCIKENRLINPLIYIITNKTGQSLDDDIDDYFIPIEILSDILNGLVQKLDCVLSPLLYSLSNIDLYYDDFFYSKQYLTYKICWYCCLILDNESYYTKSALIEEKVNHFAIHIALWLICDNIMSTLISFEPFSYFKVWKKLMAKESYVNLLKGQSLGDLKGIIKELKITNLKHLSPGNFIGLLEKKVDDINNSETFKAFNDFIVFLAKDNYVKLNNELLIKAGKYLISYEAKKPTDDPSMFQEKIIKMLKEISQFSHEDLISILNSFTEDNHFDSIKEFLSSLMSTE